jgi:ABC-type Na+ efflux pump permease subunit
LAYSSCCGFTCVPKEERYLELLLSTPLSRRDYLFARLIPIVSSSLVIGSSAAIVHGLAAAAFGLIVEPKSFASTAGVILALSVCLILLVNLLILFTSDSYTALLVAFLPLMVTIFPGMIFMYRPDVFEAAPALRDLLVFPMNSSGIRTSLHIGAAQSRSASCWSQRFLSCWLGGFSNGKMWRETFGT